MEYKMNILIWARKQIYGSDIFVKPNLQPLQSSEISMTQLIQQNVPRTQVIRFDGNPKSGLTFKFREL